MCRSALTLIVCVSTCIALGCGPATIDPKPTLPLESVEVENLLQEMLGVLELNAKIYHVALRAPDWPRLIDSQTAAMVEHVKAHGRGDVSAIKVKPFRAPVGKQPLRPALEHLASTSIELAGYLDLQAGSEQLARTSVERILAQLGEEAVYYEPPDESERKPEYVMRLVERIGVLELRTLSDNAIQRAQATLEQWAASSERPEAIIIDLSESAYGGPDAAAAIGGRFAPGKLLFGVISREPSTPNLRQHAWQEGHVEGWLTDVPLVLITSGKSGSVEQALTHALREHRQARVLGSATSGIAKLMHWYQLPWSALVGIAVGEMTGTDGTSLAQKPIIPDACPTEAGLTPLSERTTAAYFAVCGTAQRQLPLELAVVYTRRWVDALREQPEAQNTVK